MKGTNEPVDRVHSLANCRKKNRKVVHKLKGAAQKHETGIFT